MPSEGDLRAFISALVRSHLGYAIQANVPYLRRTYTKSKEYNGQQLGG